MTTEFIVFSDLHAHNFQYGATREKCRHYPGLYNSRLLDTVNVLNEIRKYATDHKIEMAVFCGDLFHKRTAVSTDVRHLIIDSLENFSYDGISLSILLGNHDMGDRNGYVHSLKGLGEFSDDISVFDEDWDFTEFGSSSDVEFAFVPYRDSLEETKRNLTKATKVTSDIHKDKPVILFAHTGIQGAKVGSDYVLISDSDLSVSDILHDQFAACFFGHFHEHQQLFANGWFVGATHQHNWGDAGGSRGFLHVTVDDSGKVSFKQIKTSAPEFHVLREVEPMPSIKPNDFVRVIVPGDTKSVDIEQLKQSLNVRHLEVLLESDEPKEDFSLDITQLSPSAVLKQWVNSKLEENPNKQKFLDIGEDILKEVGYE